MNPLDWLLAILLAYSVVRAAMRGFFQEAFALVGLVLGFLFACWFYRSLAITIKGLIASPPLAELAAFLLILFATMIAAALIGKLLRRTASAVGLGVVDRLLGALFGVMRAVLLGVGLLLAVTAFLPTAPWMKKFPAGSIFSSRRSCCILRHALGVAAQALRRTATNR